MRALAFALVGACLIAGSAQAQAPGENGRYSMSPVEGGFLRLDTRTGEVSMCRPAGDDVRCRAAPDDVAALQSEIDRLAKENAELKARVAGVSPTPPPNSRTREEMDRAFDYAERFMRRMMRVLRDDPPPDRT